MPKNVNKKRKLMEKVDNETQPAKVKKVPKLVPEMYQHILSFCNAKTRLNFSLCSKESNALIQIFNKTPPETLEIKEENDGIEVDMKYDYRRKIVKKFTDFEEIGEYLMKYYKYVGQKQTNEIKVDVKKWPMSLMKMKNIKNIERWEVTTYRSMYNEFMDYLKNTDIQICYMKLEDHRDCERSERDPFSSDFFHSEVFQNLPIAHLHLHFSSPVSFDDLRTKVKKWNEETQTKTAHIKVYYTYNINMDTIFPPDQFRVGRQFVDRHWEMENRINYYIGTVVGEIKSSRFADLLKLDFYTER